MRRFTRSGCAWVVGLGIVLMACGDDAQDRAEQDCREYCTWAIGCIEEYNDENVQGPAPYGGQDVDSCTAQCAEPNAQLANFAPACYDATWSFYLDCVTEISCQELAEEDDVVEERCGGEAEQVEQVCESEGQR